MLARSCVCSGTKTYLRWDYHLEIHIHGSPEDWLLTSKLLQNCAEPSVLNLTDERFAFYFLLWRWGAMPYSCIQTGWLLPNALVALNISNQAGRMSQLFSKERLILADEVITGSDRNHVRSWRKKSSLTILWVSPRIPNQFPPSIKWPPFRAGCSATVTTVQSQISCRNWANL